MSGAYEGHRRDQRIQRGNKGHKGRSRRERFSVSEKFLRTVDLAVYAVAEVRNLEVEQQTKHQSCQSKIGEQLRLVDGQHFFHTFDFEDEAIFDDEVDGEAGRDLHPIVADRHLDLALKLQSDSTELRTKGLLIGALKKAGTQPAMDVHRRSNDPITDFIRTHLVFPLCVLCPLCVLGSRAAQQTERH